MKSCVNKWIFTNQKKTIILLRASHLNKENGQNISNKSILQINQEFSTQ
jgi:hypothetical protein